MYKKIVGILIVCFFMGAGLIPIISGNTNMDVDLNNPPNTPDSPDGPHQCNTRSWHLYRVNTTDPEGDKISYKMDWDDGTQSDWTDFIDSGDFAYFEIKWNTWGIYNVRVKAKDIHGAESDWSPPLPVTVCKNKEPLQFYKIIKQNPDLYSNKVKNYNLEPNVLPIEINIRPCSVEFIYLGEGSIWVHETIKIKKLFRPKIIMDKEFNTAHWNHSVITSLWVANHIWNGLYSIKVENWGMNEYEGYYIGKYAIAIGLGYAFYPIIQFYL